MTSKTVRVRLTNLGDAQRVLYNAKGQMVTLGIGESKTTRIYETAARKYEDASTAQARDDKPVTLKIERLEDLDDDAFVETMLTDDRTNAAGKKAVAESNKPKAPGGKGRVRLTDADRKKADKQKGKGSKFVPREAAKSEKTSSKPKEAAKEGDPTTPVELLAVANKYEYHDLLMHARRVLPETALLDPRPSVPAIMRALREAKPAS